MIAAKRIDRAKYGKLLAEALPLVIDTERERKRAHRLVESLMARKDRSPEETELVRLIAQLIQDFELKGRTERRSKPHELLQFLLDENELRQRDLLDIFGTRSVISEVVHGKRGVTRSQALRLAARFKVSPDSFIEWPSE